MRDIMTIADLRPHVIAISHADRTITLTQEIFEGIGDYTRSQPTGPSAGRVYRKNLMWDKVNHPDEPDNWFIFWCRKPMSAPTMIDHHPYKPIILGSDRESTATPSS